MTFQALASAVRVAAACGWPATDPVVLRETNNAVIWLRPHEVVAKVGRWEHSEQEFRLERAVADALARNGAPIAAPLGPVEPVRDREAGLIVTLWERLSPDDERDLDPIEHGSVLRRLHHGLRGFEGDLPSFRRGLERARKALEGLRSISAADRTVLRHGFDELLPELDGFSFTSQRLHGEPHDRNLILTASGPRWIDFGSVCEGPLEWDLAFLPQEVADEFPEASPDLVQLLRTLNSARVSTMCWLHADVEDMRWHAEHHLERVRVDLAGRR
jgi:Ser/Thr protein kinase RdoA (MazF antagonist)